MGCVQSASDKGATVADQPSLKPSADRCLKDALTCTTLPCACGQYCCSSFDAPLVEPKLDCENSATAAFGQQLGKRRRNRNFDSRVNYKYDVVSLIGKGSFSVVLKVRHRLSGGTYAMKMMPAKRGTGSFENELLILSRVRNHNVIQLIEVFRTSNRVYVVLELANGGELYDRITRKGCFTEAESIFAVRQILQGVAYLHRVGVTHRDLKPENLLYATCSADSKLMITDFGLAHLQQSAGETLMVDPCGTPEYIAPEILTRLPYTNKVDLWAVGVITYILLSGIMPFDDENRTALYRQILRGKYYFYPEFWTGISEDAKMFVASLLCTDADIRPSADLALRHHWLLQEISRSHLDLLPRHLHKSHSLNVENKRTRSTRSIRSVARSDAGRRIQKDEVERLHKDPEIMKILGNQQNLSITRNYGVV
ncbi:Serine/threonine-protein kinase H1 -like protein [Trichinella spiralis]|uniref:Serine/threonine-protein kinase H1-like protein n=1 Tax=Trichinella spiralis TaxID=6334 RepID=A0A0V1BC90_TRISP|nr:Serine/threonine-protein kinase H1 -like protein [Trichinella spiralis]